MSIEHGIGIKEHKTSLAVPITSKSGLQVVVGTAPINQLDDPYSATNQVKIAYSFSEAAEKVGYSDDFKKYTLCQSIDISFRRYNIAPLILINVLDPKKHVKDNEAMVYQVVDDSVKLKIDGILLDTIKITSEDGTQNYTQNEDYMVSFDEKGYVTIAFTDNVPNNNVKVSSKSIAPELVTKEDVIGGYNIALKEETGLELVRHVYPKFGLVPGQIIAPGWSQIPEVATVMEAKCEDINGMFNCETVIDLDTAKVLSTEEIKTEKSRLGTTSTNTILCWPKVKIGEKQYYYSAALAALTAYVDSKNDNIPSQSPSNKELRIASTVLENEKEVFLDLKSGNLANSLGVVTAINVNGWRSWGNYTACYPVNTDPKDLWIVCRRFFNWYGNNWIQTFFSQVDDPTNYRLIESIVDTENQRANGYVARHHMAGAKIVFLREENPITQILAGTIRFHLYLAPFTPAQYIECGLEFDPRFIESSLFGGAY